MGKDISNKFNPNDNTENRKITALTTGKTQLQT